MHHARLLLISAALATLTPGCGLSAGPAEDASSNQPGQPATVQTQPPPADTAIRRVDEYLTQLAAAGFSGTVAVRVGNSPAFIKGYGVADESLNRPASPDTAYSIGSITKQFTATAILLLEQRGLLSVDDAVGKYIPELSADKRAITIHQLLTHSAGLPPALGDDFDKVDAAAFIGLVNSAPLLTPPGTSYEYSNAGYSLLGVVIERVSGVAYESFLHDELFVPAGMAHTGYKLANWEEGGVARGYRKGQDMGYPQEKPWAPNGPYWHLMANGGIISTAKDMLLWHDALLGDKVLGRAAKEKMFTRHVEEGAGAGTYYGYGWALFPTPRGTTLITHNGGDGVFFADFLRYVEEGVTIFVASNRDGPRWRSVGMNIAGLMLRADFEPQLPGNAKLSPGFEESPLHSAAKRVVSVLQDGSSTALRALVNEAFEPSFASMVPMEAHLNVLGQVHRNIEGATIVSVTTDSTEIEVKLKKRDGSLATLRIEFTQGEPYLVRGVAMPD